MNSEMDDLASIPPITEEEDNSEWNEEDDEFDEEELDEFDENIDLSDEGGEF